MKSYKGSENAGVSAYEMFKDGIKLEFKDGGTYSYTNRKPGKDHVKNMKTLAISGSGLTTYVNQNVRDNYDEKLK